MNVCSYNERAASRLRLKKVLSCLAKFHHLLLGNVYSLLHFI